MQIWMTTTVIFGSVCRDNVDGVALTAVCHLWHWWNICTELDTGENSTAPMPLAIRGNVKCPLPPVRLLLLPPISCLLCQSHTVIQQSFACFSPATINTEATHANSRPQEPVSVGWLEQANWAGWWAMVALLWQVMVLLRPHTPHCTVFSHSCSSLGWHTRGHRYPMIMRQRNLASNNFMKFGKCVYVSEKSFQMTRPR